MSPTPCVKIAIVSGAHTWCEWYTTTLEFSAAHFVAPFWRHDSLQLQTHMGTPGTSRSGARETCDVSEKVQVSCAKFSCYDQCEIRREPGIFFTENGNNRKHRGSNHKTLVWDLQTTGGNETTCMKVANMTPRNTNLFKWNFNTMPQKISPKTVTNQKLSWVTV